MRAVASFLLVLVLTAGCFNAKERADDGPTDLPVADRPVTAAPLVSYLHDVSPMVPGLSFANATVEQYRTQVTELLELDTWIARPNVAEKVPIVLEVTPYYGGGAPTGLGRVGTELIARGYAVGVSSVRGTGQSGGCFSQGGAQEALDTAAVVEHLAAQEWSNGNVGIMGVSYPGTTPQDVWVEAPPSLKTIIPISGISDLYRYNFVHGVHVSPQGYAFNLYYWLLEGPTAATVADRDPQHSALAAAGEACPEQVAVQEGGATSAVDGNKDAYWIERDFGAELRASWDKNPQRASVWYIHGLQDWNVKPHMMEDWLPAILETGVDYKVWLGQWPHAWPASTATTEAGLCLYDNEADRGNSCRADWWGNAMVAWFDQFLRGIDTGILDAPRVQVQDDDGRWHHEQVWPPTNVARHRFHFTGDGGLDQTVSGSGSATFHDGAGAAAGATLPVPGVPLPAFEARWRSEPIPAEWLVSGFAVFHGNVTASGARANLILSLAEELPDGTLRSFNFCVQSLNHARSLESGDPDISGMRQEVEVKCFPQDDVLHAGSRLVVIASGNVVANDEPAPGFQPLASGSLITIDAAGAWLELPVDHSIVYEDPQPYAEDPTP
ncbi:MAG: CocE/NonD family hydrolase [Candidatus Thermoplasmatota archaeon]